MLDEIQTYQERYGATNFDFYDLTAIVKRSWIIQFTQTILERKMEFTWQLPSGTRSEAIDDEVSRLLYESGCRNMSYAPESGSPEVLKRIKKVVKLDRLEASVLGAVRNGLNVKLNIIMGFPERVAEGAGPDGAFSRPDGVRRRPRHEHLAVLAVSRVPSCITSFGRSGRIPELSDEYFLGPVRLQGLLAVHLVHRRRDSRAILNMYRMLGFLVFYGVQYAVRPWRMVRLLDESAAASAGVAPR